MAVNETVERIVFDTVDKGLTAVPKQGAAAVAQLRNGVDSLKGTLAGLGATVSAGAMVVLYKDTLNAIAALDDMHESTGATVEGLSAIQRVARVGGHDFEGLTGQIGKMIKGLREGSDEGGRAARALDLIGVRARETDGRFRDTGEVLVEVAKKLSLYREDGNKVALVQDILGRGAERYLPLLKEMAEGTDLHATVTAKQAENVERAEKNLKRMHLTLEDGRRELVNNYTPAFNKFLEQLLEGARISGGLGSSLLELGGTDALFGAGMSPKALIDRADANLAELQASRETMGGLKGYEDQLKQIDRQIAIQQRNREYAKFLQRQEALELGGEGSLDMRDRQARRPVSESAPGVPTTGTMTAAQIAKQWDEAKEEEAKVLSEIAALTSEFRAKELEQQRKFRALDLQETDSYYEVGGAQLIKSYEDRNAILIEQADLDEARQVAEGERILEADGMSHSLRLEQLRLNVDDEAALAQHAFDQRLLMLSAFSDEELAIYGGRFALIEGMTAEHQARLLSIETGKHQAQRSMEMTTFSLAAGLLQQLPGKSKAAAIAVIAINKGLAIAQTVQATAAATMRAFSDLGPIAGIPAAASIKTLGAIQIGLIAATGLVEAANVGRGGGSPQGVFQADPSTGMPLAPPAANPATFAQQQGGSTLVINWQPGGRKLMTMDDVADLFDLMNEAAKKGARLDRVIFRQS